MGATGPAFGNRHMFGNVVILISEIFCMRNIKMGETRDAQTPRPLARTALRNMPSLARDLWRQATRGVARQHGTPSIPVIILLWTELTSPRRCVL